MSVIIYFAIGLVIGGSIGLTVFAVLHAGRER